MPGNTRITLALVAAGALAIAAVVFAAGLFSGGDASATVTHTPCGPLRSGNEASSRLRVVGTQMRDSSKKVVTPYGISLVGGPQTVVWERSEPAAAAQIKAAFRYWHANAVRVQVSEALLLDHPTPGHSYNVKFAKGVARLVCLIIKRHRIAVINDSQLFTGRERGPGARTLRFWSYMSRRYGNRFPSVIFDLFNEPQVTKNPRTKRFLKPSHVWRVWRSGGTVGGTRYVGMQDLVNEIRVKQHVKNVIWAEEPYYLAADKARLSFLPRHLLTGADIMYAFHKPSMDPRSRSFADVRSVARQGIPLIDSEWGQFAATDRPWMCQRDAYNTAPPYLQFLRDSSIGMLVWSLQPGALVRGIAGTDTVHDGPDLSFTADPRKLAKPSAMKPNYGCTRRAQGQGNGRMVMDYFARYSVAPPAELFPKLG